VLFTLISTMQTKFCTVVSHSWGSSA